MATPTVAIQQNANFTVGLSWDQTSSKPADLDLACVAIGPTGLIIDACFFNNQLALNGALVHSGDQTSGEASGIDESITVLSTQIPPHTYSLIFCLMQPGGSDLQACETAQLHLWSPETQSALMAPLCLGASVPKGCCFSVLGISRRQQGGNWAFDSVLHPMPPPAKNFMDVIPQLLALVNIDPLLAQEMKNAQPVFKLTKDNSWMLPVGLTHVAAGLGWDSRCDVDASCLGFSAQGDQIFNVYFGNKQDLNGAIVHSGDNVTGVGAGDDEVIKLNLAAIPPTVDTIFFTVNVYSGGSFADVKGEYWRLFDITPGPNCQKEFVRFDSLDNGKFRGVVLVGLFRNPSFPSQWIVSAPALGSNANTSRGMIADCQNAQAAFRNGGVAPAGFVATGIVPRLKITLNGGNNLPAMDIGGTSDPFVIVLDEYKTQLIKTKVHKKTLNPVWNESFTVAISSSKRLTFKVYDYDLIGSNDKIGNVEAWALPDAGPDPTQMTLNIVNKKGKPCGTLNITIQKV